MYANVYTYMSIWFNFLISATNSYLNFNSKQQILKFCMFKLALKCSKSYDNYLISMIRIIIKFMKTNVITMFRHIFYTF